MNQVRGKIKQKIRSAASADETQEIIDGLQATVDRQRRRIGDLEREVARVSPQVAALEARLESLRELVERPEPAPVGANGSEGVDATAILVEVQRQQEQVRARITAATRFEERLRRLEEGHADG